MITKECLLCHFSFDTENSKRMFCCKGHKDTFSKLKMGIQKTHYIPGKRKCIECGQEFEINRFHTNQRFCSLRCNVNNTHRTHQKPEERQQKQCIICGKTFMPDKLYQPYQKYCSFRCGRRAIEKRYEQRHPGHGSKKVKKYRQTEPGKINHRVSNKISSYKRRMKMSGGDLTTIQLKEIENKYGCCVFCSTKTELTKEHRLTNDHIISVDDDGENTKYNITRSCHSCNSSRQEKDVFWWCDKKGFKVPDMIILLLKKQLEEKRFVPKNIEEILNKI